MFTLSKAWGWFLLVLQLLNAIAAGLTYLSMVPGLPESAHAQVLAWNVGIAAAVGALQAVAKGLADTDGDGVPDIFQPRKPT